MSAPGQHPHPRQHPRKRRVGPVFLTRGQLAAQGGVNPETVRYYERQGLLPAPPRSETGYRQFPPDAVERILFIKRAQTLGFHLGEIRELLTLWSDPARAGDLEERMATLLHMRHHLLD